MVHGRGGMKQPIGIDQPIAADDKGHGADPKGP